MPRAGTVVVIRAYLLEGTARPVPGQGTGLRWTDQFTTVVSKVPLGAGATRPRAWGKGFGRTRGLRGAAPAVREAAPDDGFSGR
ncbi:hypothetical protein BIV24_13585 [Streptomyces colonosanans]|uniref:Uncharacterized protein n=1 Tax=Streptomyces colonosanans TaxID=1428652 RepID=A0A1S2PF99_9ACTN|nr:hypothetical protein BIV24_13585 [Streptomyces colonosanans]